MDISPAKYLFARLQIIPLNVNYEQEPAPNICTLAHIIGSSCKWNAWILQQILMVIVNGFFGYIKPFYPMSSILYYWQYNINHLGYHFIRAKLIILITIIEKRVWEKKSNGQCLDYWKIQDHCHCLKRKMEVSSKRHKVAILSIAGSMGCLKKWYKPRILQIAESKRSAWVMCTTHYSVT